MECLGLSVESSGELLVEQWGMGWRRVWISKRGVADFYELCVGFLSVALRISMSCVLNYRAWRCCFLRVLCRIFKRGVADLRM